ncbi:MAG: outer membrane beta-barrel protein [Deltaproteobacteria bacterium]|jgi:opacity protein-like surface antigen|nr:outer membrane beta-barrel protein [Deltaproteobacteria bacterium]
MKVAATIGILSLLPVLALAQPRLAATGSTAPTVAPPGSQLPAAVAQPEPWARFNRFGFSLMFGFGSAGLDRLQDLGEAMLAKVGVPADKVPTSGLQINAEVAFRYYFPYYVMAQVGYATVYNKASSDYMGVALHSDALVMETPILLGGYYPFIERLYVYAAAGPSVFFFPRSYWDAEPGGIPDFKADTGVGFTFLTGADFLVTEVFAVGLELRYRNLKTGELRERESGVLANDPRIAGGKPYDLDFSGVSLGVILRFYVI